MSAFWELAALAGSNRHLKNVFTGGEEMSNEKKVIGEEAIYDAKSLGTSKMLILGVQHMLAMF